MARRLPEQGVSRGRLEEAAESRCEVAGGRRLLASVTQTPCFGGSGRARGSSFDSPCGGAAASSATVPDPAAARPGRAPTGGRAVGAQRRMRPGARRAPARRRGPRRPAQHARALVALARGAALPPPGRGGWAGDCKTCGSSGGHPVPGSVVLAWRARTSFVAFRLEGPAPEALAADRSGVPVRLARCRHGLRHVPLRMPSSGPDLFGTSRGRGGLLLAPASGPGRNATGRAMGLPVFLVGGPRGSSSPVVTRRGRRGRAGREERAGAQAGGKLAPPGACGRVGGAGLHVRPLLGAAHVLSPRAVLGRREGAGPRQLRRCRHAGPGRSP